jgi:hypothetical protein
VAGPMGVNVTPSVGIEGARGAERSPSAADSSCAGGPALTLGGVSYPCRVFVPTLPALQARARTVIAPNPRVRQRRGQRARVELLRAFVNQVVIDRSALPRRWWADPALQAEAIREGVRLTAAYDEQGRVRP